MNELISQFLEWNRKSLAPSSQIEYSRDLRQLEIWLSRKDTAIQDASNVNIQEYLRTGRFGRRLANRKLSVFRSFYSYLVDIGVIETNPAIKLRRFRVEELFPYTLSIFDLSVILNVRIFRDEFRQLLTNIILRTFYYTGIRLSELIGINIGDIDYELRRIRVIGKGSKERMVKFPNSLVSWFHSYFVIREQVAGETAWFVNPRGKRITQSQVEYIFTKLKKETGIRVRPHSLRHTFATHALDQGMNLAQVKELLGHKSIATTGIYVHITESLEESYDRAFP